MIHSSTAPDEQDLQLRAFVLCGGLGTRLRPVLSDRPKSMAPVGGVPFLQLLLEDLKAQGIGEVILGTVYMADQVQAFCRRGAEFGLRVCYAREDEPLFEYSRNANSTGPTAKGSTLVKKGWSHSHAPTRLLGFRF